MNTPKPFLPLVVRVTGEGDYHGITYSPDRGFFDPITNRSFADVNMHVESWHYAPVALWPGAMVRHKKRGSSYEIVKPIDGRMIGDAPDGTKITGLPGSRGPVMVQRSTKNHSPEWALYEDYEGQQFVRPLSEFTEDRFKILYNGA